TPGDRGRSGRRGSPPGGPRGIPRRRRSCLELDRDGVGDDSRLVAGGEEGLDGPLPAGAVIEREVVDVHADETIRERSLQAAAEVHGVGDRLLAVRQAEGEAFLEEAADLL